MKLTRCATIALSLAPSFAAVAQAQSVWVVDASGHGDFADLPDAVAAAQDGDVLLVKTGSYAQVVLDGKGLAIVADEAADVVVDRLYVSNLTADQSVLARGLDVFEQSGTGADAIQVRDCAGPIWLEGCLTRFSTDYPSTPFSGDGIDVLRADSVTIVDCVVRAELLLDASASLFQYVGSGLHATDSNVVAHRSTFHGAKGFPATYLTSFGGVLGAHPGTAGVWATGGEMLLYDCTLLGGDGGDQAIVLGQCYPGADGGPGLRTTKPLIGGSAALVDLAASALTGGQPGTDAGLGCGTGLIGPDIFLDGGQATPIAVSDTPRTLVAPTVVRENRVIALAFSGGALDEEVWLGVSFHPATAFHPEYENALTLAEPIYVIHIGSMPPAGSLGASFAIPDLATTEGLVLYLQSLHVGTEAHLGTASAVTLIDDTL